MRALRGSNAAAVIAALTPIIRGWAAYYRGVVSSKIFGELDDYVWKLTYRWAKRTHSGKPKRWVVHRYFGRFNKFRNDRWVFGNRGRRRRTRQHPAPDQVRLDSHRPAPAGHRLGVTRRSGPDRLLGRPAASGSSPRWTATTCACSPGRRGAVRSAATTCSPPTSHPSPHGSGNAGG